MHHRYEIVGGNKQQQHHRTIHARHRLLIGCSTIGLISLLCWVALEGWPASFLIADQTNKTSSPLRNPQHNVPSSAPPPSTEDETVPTAAEQDARDDDEYGESDDDGTTEVAVPTITPDADLIEETPTIEDNNDDDELYTEDDDGDIEDTVAAPPTTADTSSTHDHTPDSTEQTADVAWIVSFGGSGTSYTILNTEAMSGQSTASNYARDYKTLIPVHDDFEFGPYIRSPEKPLPEKFILTKTHCGGYCMDCPPSSYVFHTALDFQEACRTSHIEEDGQLVEQVYEADIPKRAVHLVRSPFDNVVGRFHLSVKRWKKRPGANVTELETTYSNTAEGLLNWCRYLDEQYAQQEMEYPILKKYQNVPCHAEWFRYIQWHNLADTVIHDLDIPVHYLWYHNYTSGFDDTVESLFQFLSLEATYDPYEWHAGHSYKSFYPTELRKAAITMMKDLASATTWRLIGDYIADYSETDVLENTPEEFVEFDEGEFNHDEDSLYVHEKEHVSGPPVDTKNSNAVDAKVVWLLSFPNSGTSYTISNIEAMADVTTATNYARDLDNPVPLTPHGPFLHRKDKKTPQYALTKTHCTGYCNDCPPNAYLPRPDPYHFTQGCTTVDRPETGEIDSYPEYVPEKAVHLFRDPFDNIVSRMHLEVKKTGNEFETNREGLANYCNYFDGKYTQEEREAFDENTRRLFHKVPCHADFFRYAVWHNQAMEMTERLELPVHYLYYENYTNAYDETTTGLLNFLDLEATAKPLQFTEGKVYRYLWEDELDSVRELMESTASPATWNRIRHYFDS